jgi:hypothetical protein
LLQTDVSLVQIARLEVLLISAGQIRLALPQLEQIALEVLAWRLL